MKKWLSLAASTLIVASFTACGSDDNNNSENTTTTTSSSAVAATKVEFIGMDAPSSQADMSKAYSTAKARVYTSATEYTDYPLSYDILFDVKTRVGTNPHPAGQLYNARMEPLKDPYGEPLIAETPDANSLLKVDDKLFLVSHLEYDDILSDGVKAYKTAGWYSRAPMNMILTDIEQNENGTLTAVDQKPIDHSSVHGGWIFCFGSQTPWNTHLGGEEDYDLYYTETTSKGSRAVAGVRSMTELYFDDNNATVANPYHYGYNQEVVVKGDGSYDLHKRYAMGRGTWEMSQVFGDAKTALYGDDGSNVFMMMFVGDKANDLSAGTLYASKFNQTNADGSATAEGTLEWIKLGHATEQEVSDWTETHTFSDIFDYLSAEDVDANASTTGYTAIKAGQTTVEYLKVKPGKELVAAFLESRRYAAMKGATTEWNKMEGIAIDNTNKKAYMAISYQDKGMLADDSFATDHIRVAKNNCGATYQISLKGGQKDSEGNDIASEYVGTSIMAPAGLVGEEIAADAKGNTCNVNKIANTDNIAFSDKMKTLFIGEDSGTHTNNFVWAYNVETTKLSRLLSVPAGAECTGLQVVENMNGHAYIMSNSQHHADFTKTTPDELKEALAPNIDRFGGNFGYIGGMPGIK
ncbi:MAG: alkaline phosphatase [Campylobacterota bacterium]|nr:alkaline phosphatase [Campylobacterota bacterium]